MPDAQQLLGIGLFLVVELALFLTVSAVVYLLMRYIDAKCAEYRNRESTDA